MRYWVTPDLQVRKWSLREGKALTWLDHLPWVSQDGSVEASPASCSRSPGVTLPASFPVEAPVPLLRLLTAKNQELLWLWSLWKSLSLMLSILIFKLSIEVSLAFSSYIPLLTLTCRNMECVGGWNLLCAVSRRGMWRVWLVLPAAEVGVSVPDW